MHVEDDVHVVLGRPSDDALEVGQLAVDPRLIRADVAEDPIAERHAHVVDAGLGEEAHVLLGDPGVPVLLELSLALLLAQVLTEGPLVDDAIARRELLEQRRHDPRLEHQPAAEVDAANLRLAGIGGFGTWGREESGEGEGEKESKPNMEDDEHGNVSRFVAETTTTGGMCALSQKSLILLLLGVRLTIESVQVEVGEERALGAVDALASVVRLLLRADHPTAPKLVDLILAVGVTRVRALAILR